MWEVGRNRIRDGSFEVGPNEFIGIELGRVAWEAVKTQTCGGAQELLHEYAAVLVDIVPHDEDQPIQALEQQAQESNDIRGADVAVTKESGVKRDLLSIGLDADRRDRRDLGPPASAPQDRSLPARCPGPGDGRNQ